MESNSISTAEDGARGNAGVALASVFFSPTRCFQEIARGAHWFWGFVASAGLAVVGAMVQAPFVRSVSQAQLARMPEEHRQAAEKMVGVQTTMQVVMTPAVWAIGLLVASLVFLGVTRAMGIGLRFKKIFAGLSYAALVTAVGGVVVAVLSRRVAMQPGGASGIGDMPRVGLDLLVPSSEGFVRGLLASFSVFSVWWVVVLVYGVAVLAGRRPRQVAPAVILAGFLCMLLLGLITGVNFALASRQMGGVTN